MATDSSAPSISLFPYGHRVQGIIGDTAGMKATLHLAIVEPDAISLLQPKGTAAVMNDSE